MKTENSGLPETLWTRLRHLVLGRARDVHDPSLAHKISLIAFLAWVGLGADGLSSSAYGPEEGFRALGQHTYLAVLLALATALTVFIISYAYSRIIEHFPQGGGGYLVATELLGKHAGVVSGCALLVDYVLTITVSIAAGADAVFSLLPPAATQFKLAGMLPLKLVVECGAIVLLVVMNLRGVKESVAMLVPIFLTFVVTHVVLILGAIIAHTGRLPVVVHEVHSGFRQGLVELGGWGMFLLFLRAYSLGGGTYTGIEAVSNGLQIMRQPRVETGKRTMRYMAVSLAAMAGGLLLCYLLFDVRAVPGKTLNTVLVQNFAGGFRPGGLPLGLWFATVTIAAEAVLLLVAAQTGFIDGPRVMANMSVDSWLPRRFSALSDRLTIQNGILLIGLGATAILWVTRGHVETLVVMYSLNVFLTFSLSQAGMMRFWIKRRHDPQWKTHLPIHLVGFVLCVAIFIVMVLEKLREGAWLTLMITCGCIAVCLLIRRYYVNVTRRVRAIDQNLADIPSAPGTRVATDADFDARKPTAVVLVGGYGRLGVHIFLSIFRIFPKTFQNIVFLTVGVIDSEFFKEGQSMDAKQRKTRDSLDSFVGLARRLGIPARAEFRIGADIVHEASDLCLDVARRYPRAVFFAGELLFEEPRWYHRILHNETAYAIQRQVRFAGLPMVILPIVLRSTAARPPLGGGTA